MSKQRAKGTRGENAVVEALIAAGYVHAERRSLAGVNDKGDITGIPGWVIEVKYHDSYAGKLAGWVEEAEVERQNAKAFAGVVWHRRKGKGSAADWFVTMSGATFLSLMKEVDGFGD